MKFGYIFVICCLQQKYASVDLPFPSQQVFIQVGFEFLGQGDIGNPFKIARLSFPSEKNLQASVQIANSLHCFTLKTVI